MAEDVKIDLSRFTGAEQNEAKRQQASQAEREKNVPYFQKQQEKDGSLTYSGASGGGGVWAGRSR